MICYSAVYRTFAKKDCSNELDMERLLELFKKCRSVSKKYGDRLNGITTFAAIKEVVKDDNRWKLLAATLAEIENKTSNLFKDDHKTKVKNKKLLLELGGMGFFTSLTNKNDRVIKATHKINL